MNHMQQQSPFEFMKFIEVQGEKHLGIAVIRYERRFIFRFKIMPSDQGGYWVTSASMKIGTANGKDKYEPAFSLDSDYEKSQMTDFVLACVEEQFSRKVNTQQSVFSRPAEQPHQTFQQQAQAQSQYGQAQNSSNAFNDDNIPF